MSRTQPSAGVPRAIPYAVTGIGLVAGLAVVVFQPLPSPVANYVVGGAGLLAAVVAVGYMVIAHGHPGDRGPDFE